MKKRLSSLFLAAALYAAAPGQAQVKPVDRDNKLQIASDSALSDMLDSAVAAKAKITYRLTAEDADTVLRFTMYPAKDGIAFLQFKDANANGIYEKNELSYAEYSDAYCDVVVKDTGLGLAVTRKELERSSFKSNEVYISARAAFNKHPAPLQKSPEDVANWVIDRVLQKKPAP